MWNYGANQPRQMWRDGQEVWPKGKSAEKRRVRSSYFDPVDRVWWYITEDGETWREGQLDGEYLNGVVRSFGDLQNLH